MFFFSIHYNYYCLRPCDTGKIDLYQTNGTEPCIRLIIPPPSGMEDEICPYATFHLLGFREEMDPAAKAAAMNSFQTFPHQNGHTGTLGTPPNMTNGHLHQRSGSQSMVRGFKQWTCFKLSTIDLTKIKYVTVIHIKNKRNRQRQVTGSIPGMVVFFKGFFRSCNSWLYFLFSFGTYKNIDDAEKKTSLKNAPKTLFSCKR